MQPGSVELQTREDAALDRRRRLLHWGRLQAETVDLRAPCGFDYRWADSSHYLALHDIRLADGELRVDGAANAAGRDLRNTLTYAPPGCEISGWSVLGSGRHSFTCVSIAPQLITEELELPNLPNAKSARVYFSDDALRTTLMKVRSLLTDDNPADTMHIETVGLLAIYELEKISRDAASSPAVTVGSLSALQAKLARDYMLSNLHRDVTLKDIAQATGLSRFHFVRAFKKTFGVPPYQFLQRARLGRAAELLTESQLDIAEIGAMVGFKQPARFSSAFTAWHGETPQQYRRKRTM